MEQSRTELTSTQKLGLAILMQALSDYSLIFHDKAYFSKAHRCKVCKENLDSIESARSFLYTKGVLQAHLELFDLNLSVDYIFKKLHSKQMGSDKKEVTLW